MISYKSAGVDISKADKLVKRLQEKLPGIGGFGGIFPLPLKEYKEPLLVASTDGVGTKLMVAQMMNNHKTVGIDLVAMVVNDLAACGARPLFFLDYYSVGKLNISHAEQVLAGIMEGCRLAECSLLGGETAELPGVYDEGHYDMAGFGVGIVEKVKIIDGSRIKPGNLLIGIPSSGLHSNGYSLARKVLIDKEKLPLNKKCGGMKKPLGKILLEPTKIYSPLMVELAEKRLVRGMAHITGGGIPGNLNRILPENIDAQINVSKWKIPEIFKLIAEKGPVTKKEMFKTFNMGIGLIIALSRRNKIRVMEICSDYGYKPAVIGEAVEGSGNVVLGNSSI